MRLLGFNYKNARINIVLKPKQKRDRLRKILQWHDRGLQWSRVVWTDEKRFCCDGPDNWQSWMLEHQPVERNRRQQGGPAMQVWGALIPGPMLAVFELPPRGDARAFIDFFECDVLPTLRAAAGEDFILHQDRAPTHTSRYSQDAFARMRIPLLDWPSRSPDLNLIENCWSMIASRVYDGPQYNNIDDLWAAIDDAVTDLNTNCRDQLQALFDSIPTRLDQCIRRRGDRVDY